jgi:hypothetical protein
MAASSTGRLERRHVLTFSTPLRLGILAATLVAIGVLASLLLPSFGLIPGPTDASPTASETATVAPGTSPTPSASAEPTATPTPSLTRVPAATPAPTVSPTTAWTGLTWSDPVTPPFEINLWDVVAWRDGYVGVGLAQGEFAFLASSDGLRWTVMQQVEPGWGIAGDWNLVAYRDELFSFSPSMPDVTAPQGGIRVPWVHHSTDGRTWSPIESPTWADAWSTDALILDVDAGPNGIVAIGNARAGEHGELLAEPVVLRSSDGVTWSAGELEGAPAEAVVWDVVAWSDGYAILGGIQQEGSVVGAGLPAAWWSTDGLHWAEAAVEGAAASDNHFEPGSAFAAAEGLVARAQVLSAGGPPDLRGWLSIDGRRWSRATDLFVELPSGLMASDGARLVAFATDADWTPLGDDPEPYPGLTRAWLSLDGATWRPMSLSHPMTDQLAGFWVAPDGVIYAGAQSFWFGTPITP